MAQVSSTRLEATNLVNDISQSVNTARDIHLKVVDLTKHLFANQYLLYSDLKQHLESSGILKVLMSSLEELQEPSRRDILRLIYLVIQVNKTLRGNARQAKDFQAFIQRSLSDKECWDNMQRFKHHINIASELLVDKDIPQCSYINPCIKSLARRALHDIISRKNQEDENIFPCIVFYGCAMTGYPKINDEEPDAEKILTKEITGKCLDIIRDYIHDFKMFYTLERNEERGHQVLYKPKSEYSFQQISTTLIYYCTQSAELRMNIFQSGVYEMINNLLSLKYIAEPLIRCGTDFLQLPSQDPHIVNGLKNEYFKIINEKLQIFLQRETLSEKTKKKITELLRQYIKPNEDSFPQPSGEVIRASLNNDSFSFAHVNNETRDSLTCSGLIYVKDWTQQDVKQWLSDNHLEDLREIFSYLSGHGLLQLKSLAKEEEKMKFIMFLMDRLRIRFDMSLELVSALERL